MSKSQGRRLETRSEGVDVRVVTTDIDTLATALHVRTDDLLRGATLAGVVAPVECGRSQPE